jgi:hypothetical protein
MTPLYRVCSSLKSPRYPTCLDCNATLPMVSVQSLWGQMRRIWRRRQRSAICLLLFFGRQLVGGTRPRPDVSQIVQNRTFSQMPCEVEPICHHGTQGGSQCTVVSNRVDSTRYSRQPAYDPRIHLGTAHPWSALTDEHLRRMLRQTRTCARGAIGRVDLRTTVRPAARKLHLNGDGPDGNLFAYQG